MRGANYRDFSAYFESKIVCITTVKERTDLHSLITVGRAFHMSEQQMHNYDSSEALRMSLRLKLKVRWAFVTFYA